MSNALTSPRDVIISFVGGITAVEAPLDFYKACLETVRKSEDKIAKIGLSLAVNLTSKKIRLTGATPYNLYEVVLTTDVDGGGYEFEYLGTFNNTDEAIEAGMGIMM